MAQSRPGANEAHLSAHASALPDASERQQHSAVHDLLVDAEDQGTITQSQTDRKKNHLKHRYYRVIQRFGRIHSRTPYLRRVPLNSILIILLLAIVNILVWIIVLLILLTHNPPYAAILSTAALAYSLGLRHALDADHISAIDLMTRRLIATGQRPVTVGTFFSLGHSTIVIITSIVVAATAAGVSKRFDRFSNVGGIIGTSVSAAFLIILGTMNGYILYRLIVQLRKVIRLSPKQEISEAWKVEGGGVMFRVLKKMFKLIDRPWKMYPLGVLFGLGFDTSSEVALLGIASIQGAKGTSIWLILIFPVLFTVGMCLIDTIDGALMAGLYLAPLQARGTGGDDKKNVAVEEVSVAITDENDTRTEAIHDETRSSLTNDQRRLETQNLRVKSPLTFLYYSIILTALTVVVALVIGVIQLLSLILNVAVSDDEVESNPFWHGVEMAGEYYDIIGAAICGSFVIVGLASVVLYKPWKRWVERRRQRLQTIQDPNQDLTEGIVGDDQDNADRTIYVSEPRMHSMRGQVDDNGRVDNAGSSHNKQTGNQSGRSDTMRAEFLHETITHLDK